MPTKSAKHRHAPPHAPTRPPAPTRFLSAGDRSRAICPACKAMRETVYEYRAVPLERSKVTVPNVLVGVCTTCDATVSLPAQSTPRLREARERTMKEQNARIPLELEDRLNVIAQELDFRPAPFKGALCRYALFRVAGDRKFAQLVWKNARSPGAKGTPGAKVKFRAEDALPQAAMAAAQEVGIEDLSSILRGAILTVSELLGTPKERGAMLQDLRLLAVGSGS